MLNNILRLILVAVLFVCSGKVSAQSVGNYTCNDCLLTQPVPDGDTLIYIRSVVNLDVDTWWNSSAGEGKRVTICNASKCVVYQYQANGNFVAIASSNIQGGGGGGGGGSPPGSGYTWGVVSYSPIYMTGTVCTSGGCSSQSILVGFAPMYGWIPGRPRPPTMEP